MGISDDQGSAVDPAHEVAGYVMEAARSESSSFPTSIAPADIVAGALFDFLGYLTTRSPAVVCGRAENASLPLEAMKAWAKNRGLELEDADVLGWQERLIR